MDVAQRITQRLRELDLVQKDLARAAEVTESYISQLLTRKKVPPAPNRTDIYERLERCLKLAPRELSRLAEFQRRVESTRGTADEPTPLFREVRAMILRKCSPEHARAVQAVFERQPFGELERLVIRAMLDVTRPVAREELQNERWLRLMARASGRSYEEMRVIVLEFLDTDSSSVSIDGCTSFLDPLITSWTVDLATFELEIVLNHPVPGQRVRRFGFVEREREAPASGEPGLEEFLRDRSLSGTATQDEISFLKRLKFGAMRPTALYYYRELQNLRDPLHFTARHEVAG